MWYFGLKISGFWSAGVEEPAVINKKLRTTELKPLSAGTIDAVIWGWKVIWNEEQSSIIEAEYSHKYVLRVGTQKLWS